MDDQTKIFAMLPFSGRSYLAGRPFRFFWYFRINSIFIIMSFNQTRACICKCLRSPEIDSEESIPPAYVAWARICKRLSSPGINSEESIPPANVANAVRHIGLSYRPAMLKIDSWAPWKKVYTNKGSANWTALMSLKACLAPRWDGCRLAGQGDPARRLAGQGDPARRWSRSMRRRRGGGRSSPAGRSSSRSPPPPLGWNTWAVAPGTEFASRARFFLSFKKPKNRFQGTSSARLCSLAGRYDNHIHARFLAHIECSKIPAQGDPPKHL